MNPEAAPRLTSQRIIYNCALFSPCLMFASWCFIDAPQWIQIEWVFLIQLAAAVASVVFCSLFDSCGRKHGKIRKREFFGWIATWSIVQIALHLLAVSIATLIMR